MAWRYRWVLYAVAAIAACESDARGGSNSEPVLGAPCAALDVEWCGPDGDVRRCIAGHWAIEDCEAHCTSRGFEWIGCHEIDPLTSCECDLPATPPRSACLDAHTLLVCTASCEAHACTDVCAASVLDSESLGCFATPDGSATCSCAPGDMPCDASEPARCDGEAALAVCIDGAWSLQNCDVQCAPLFSAGCRLADDGSAGCSCVDLEGE